MTTTIRGPTSESGKLWNALCTFEISTLLLGKIHFKTSLDIVDNFI